MVAVSGRQTVTSCLLESASADSARGVAEASAPSGEDGAAVVM